MYFPDRGCVRPLRHFYGYATAADSNLIQRETVYRCPAGLAAVRVCLQSADGSPDDNIMCIEFHQFHAYSYSAPDGGARSIVMSVSVCLSVCVCLSAIVSSELHSPSSPNSLCMLPMAVTRPSSGDVVICYLFPVLWMTSYLHIS